MTFTAQAAAANPAPQTFHNLDRVIVQGTLDAKAYPTGIFVECLNPLGMLVLAQVISVPPAQAQYSESNFVLGGTPDWVTGKYTFKLYWNPENGPTQKPAYAEVSFEYQA